MENNLILNSTNELVEAASNIVEGFRRLAEAASNLLVPLARYQRVSADFATNNYLKMHGYTIRRNKALNTFERRHRSG